MICVPISRNSRGSSALTLACVPTGMNTGVSITPRVVVSRPSRPFDAVSVSNNSNMRWVVIASPALLIRFASQSCPKPPV